MVTYELTGGLRKVKAIATTSLPSPKFRYSSAVHAGPFIKTAGLVGVDRSSGELVSGVIEQTHCILSNVWRFMEEKQLILSNMVSCTVYVTDFSNFPDVNKVWNTFFPEGDYVPARTTVGVVALPLGAYVEMDFLFYCTSSSDEKV